MRDLDVAVTTYRDRVGLRASEPQQARGLRFVRCTPGSGPTIDLVTPDGSPGSSETRSARRLAEKGEGLSALVLQSTDLVATRVALEKRGVTVAADGEDALEIAPADACGARIRVELA